MKATDSHSYLDPSVCSCYSGSSYYAMCNKIKWSTLSIYTALLITIVYLSSGLYALIDLTTMISLQSYDDSNYTILWFIASSSLATFLDLILLLVHFSIVISISILLCGIQLGKPCLLFIWSFMMIFMVLADGIVTILSLQEHQQQNYRSKKKIKILFSIMTVRLFFSLCAVFVIIFHCRRLVKVQSEHNDRKRMLDRYNSEASSLSYYDSWVHSATFLNPAKNWNNDHSTLDIPVPISLPRAKLGTPQHHYSTSTMIHSQNQHSTHITQSDRRTIKKYVDDFRHNIP